jgi:tRNA nucleotidyltransferase/poly(A) polymerase
MLTLPSDITFSDIVPNSTFIVGGTVRDLLLGRPALDTDIVVSADPQDFARRLAKRLSGSLVKIGKSELTIHRVVVGRRIFDVSALNGKSIEEDLERRDFTVNAMAVDVANAEIIDCTDGRRDLEAGIIRMVSPAAFTSDPVRLVRAYRLSAGLQFIIESTTRQAIADSAHLISRSAGERIWSELHKILSETSSLPTIEQMHADGLLPAIFPELTPLQDCFQGDHHRWDVFTHSLQAYRHLESMLAEPDKGTWLPAGIASSHWKPTDIPAPALKLAILLHDVGKPASRQEDKSGNVHFYGHGKKSADMVTGITSRLKMSRRDAGYIDFIIRSHVRPLHLFIAHFV